MSFGAPFAIDHEAFSWYLLCLFTTIQFYLSAVTKLP
jgi:hypothetical protein